MERRLAAILAADVAGYSRLMSQDEVATLQALTSRREVLDGLIAQHRGRIANTAGDSVLAEFPSVMDAVRCAVEAQAALWAKNEGTPEERRLQFRMGVHVGDVMVKAGDLFGDGVNIAARLQGLAEPGGVCISASAHEHVRKALPLSFQDLGPQAVKNMDEPIRAYAIRPNGAPQAQAHRGEPQSLPEKPSIAVLPFTNMSGDPEQEYFSDGITEDIITALSKHRSFLVLARNSTFAFKGRSIDVRQIGTSLGADYVVEGSVRKMGERVRITAQLIETQGGKHLWAERYDRDLKKLFEIQDEITATITARIQPEIDVAEQQRSESKPPQALQAWDFFNLGRRHLYRSTAADNREAQRLFREAIARCPTLAEPYAFLSYAIVLSMVYFEAPLEDARLDEAVDLAQRAVELDPRDALIRFAYGRALLARREYAEAVAELSAAAELNPALAPVYCGIGDSLTYESRFDEAIPCFERALELSPHDPQRWAFYSYGALAHLFARHFQEAADWAQKAIRVPNSHYWPLAHRAAALGYLPDENAAHSAADELLRRVPNFTCAVARKRLFFVKDPAHLDLYTEGLRRAGIPD